MIFLVKKYLVFSFENYQLKINYQGGFSVFCMTSMDLTYFACVKLLKIYIILGNKKNV